jgi:hypothetical protein
MSTQLHTDCDFFTYTTCPKCSNGTVERTPMYTKKWLGFVRVYKHTYYHCVMDNCPYGKIKVEKDLINQHLIGRFFVKTEVTFY